MDACKGGWIAVELDGANAAAHFLPKIGSLASAIPAAEVAAIDIPIGLPETGRRAADDEARRALGARRNSVVYTPPRAALCAASHAEGTAIALTLTGLGMSQQAYALGAKILEVEEWLTFAPCRVLEVHPEVSFAELLGAPASAPKKSWLGMVERYRALAGAGIYLEELTGAAARAAAVDDMLDAGVAAWTARRVHVGPARFRLCPLPVSTAGQWRSGCRSRRSVGSRGAPAARRGACADAPCSFAVSSRPAVAASNTHASTSSCSRATTVSYKP